MMFLLLVLMLLDLSGSSAEVVTQFKDRCGHFFVNETPPTILPGTQYKQICQTLGGHIYFATLYDTENRIPVYSAYKFEGLNNCERTNYWYIEPQLDDNNAGEDMASESSVDIDLRGVYQALNKDYLNSHFDRGHLAPVYQASSQDCSDATFTLTNAAPQNPTFNRGEWKKLEKNIANYMNNVCLPNKPKGAYIVTGVVPGNNNINNRVKVPSHFWTAYCCLDNNDKCFLSYGYLGENVQQGTGYSPKGMSVNDLEESLTQLYKTTFNIFGESIKIKTLNLKIIRKLPLSRIYIRGSSDFSH